MLPKALVRFRSEPYHRGSPANLGVGPEIVSVLQRTVERAGRGPESQSGSESWKLFQGGGGGCCRVAYDYPQEFLEPPGTNNKTG